MLCKQLTADFLEAHQDNKLAQEVFNVSPGLLLISLLPIVPHLRGRLSDEWKTLIQQWIKAQQEVVSAFKNTSLGGIMYEEGLEEIWMLSWVLDPEREALPTGEYEPWEMIQGRAQSQLQEELQKGLAEQDSWIFTLLARFDQKIINPVVDAWWGQEAWWSMLEKVVEHWRRQRTKCLTSPQWDGEYGPWWASPEENKACADLSKWAYRRSLLLKEAGPKLPVKVPLSAVDQVLSRGWWFENMPPLGEWLDRHPNRAQAWASLNQADLLPKIKIFQGMMEKGGVEEHQKSSQ